MRYARPTTDRRPRHPIIQTYHTCFCVNEERHALPARIRHRRRPQGCRVPCSVTSSHAQLSGGSLTGTPQSRHAPRAARDGYACRSRPARYLVGCRRTLAWLPNFAGTETESRFELSAPRVLHRVVLAGTSRFSASRMDLLSSPEIPANRRVDARGVAIAVRVVSWDSLWVMDVAAPPRPFRLVSSGPEVAAARQVAGARGMVILMRDLDGRSANERVMLATTPKR